MAGGSTSGSRNSSVNSAKDDAKFQLAKQKLKRKERSKKRREREKRDKNKARRSTSVPTTVEEAAQVELQGVDALALTQMLNAGCNRGLATAALFKAQNNVQTAFNLYMDEQERAGEAAAVAPLSTSTATAAQPTIVPVPLVTAKSPSTCSESNENFRALARFDHLLVPNGTKKSEEADQDDSITANDYAWKEVREKKPTVYEFDILGRRASLPTGWSLDSDHVVIKRRVEKATLSLPTSSVISAAAPPASSAVSSTTSIHSVIPPTVYEFDILGRRASLPTGWSLDSDHFVIKCKVQKESLSAMPSSSRLPSTATSIISTTLSRTGTQSATLSLPTSSVISAAAPPASSAVSSTTSIHSVIPATLSLPTSSVISAAAPPASSAVSSTTSIHSVIPAATKENHVSKD